MSLFGPCTVLISDPENPKEIEEWCRNNASFLSVVATDVSDVSYDADVIYAYTFENEEATNWFKLRWL
jgi:hypothetical protein